MILSLLNTSLRLLILRTELMVLSCTRYGMVIGILIMSTIRRRISICPSCVRGSIRRTIRLSTRLRVMGLVMDRQCSIRRCAFRLFVTIRMDLKLPLCRKMNAFVDLCCVNVYALRGIWTTLELLHWTYRYIGNLVTWRLRLLLWRLFALRVCILLRLRRKVRNWNRRLTLKRLVR